MCHTLISHIEIVCNIERSKLHHFSTIIFLVLFHLLLEVIATKSSWLFYPIGDGGSMFWIESKLKEKTKMRENRKWTYICVSVCFLACINTKDYYLFTTSSWMILQLKFKLNASFDIWTRHHASSCSTAALLIFIYLFNHIPQTSSNDSCHNIFAAIALFCAIGSACMWYGLRYDTQATKTCVHLSIESKQTFIRCKHLFLVLHSSSSITNKYT